MSKSINELNQQLDDIFEWFDSGDLDIDKAIEKYKQGQEIIEELNKKLDEAKNVIKKLKG